MSARPYWSDTYNTFGSLFYDLLGFYELRFNRDPARIMDYDKTCEASEVLPIYGKSHLPKYIMYLSQLPIVDRLTEIKQLAYTYILFPGATHTRYEHSRGVMHRAIDLLSKVAKILIGECRDEGIDITDDDKIILSIAALLHDVGHPAWGHALDGITGYVVQLLEEIGMYLFSPRKLDITVTLYLILKNDQLLKALNICSEEVKDEELRKLFGKVVAQIIMEEEHPLFEEMGNKKSLMKKIHLLTTILGDYRGLEPPGINADRLDWLIRDSHHANLGAKLSPKIASKYNEFLKLNEKGSFGVKIENCEFVSIDDTKFINLMTKLREELYSNIYEGIERSFTDSLLIRLAYSTINVIHNIGNQIASAPVTTKAVMGYLLMNDHIMKDYTNRTLHLAKQHKQILGIDEPSATFISETYGLLKLIDDLKYIMHYLSSTPIKEDYVAEMGVHLQHVELRQIDKNLIILSAKTFGNLVERASKVCKKTEACKLAILFQDLLATSRINPIGASRTPILESALQAEFKNLDIAILVNYYFFRKLDDCFRREIFDISSLKKVLEEKLKSTPLFFVITEKIDQEMMEKIFQKLCADVLNHFVSLFHSMEATE